MSADAETICIDILVTLGDHWYSFRKQKQLAHRSKCSNTMKCRHEVRQISVMNSLHPPDLILQSGRLHGLMKPQSPKDFNRVCWFMGLSLILNCRMKACGMNSNFYKTLQKKERIIIIKKTLGVIL